jgi:hypothetical protein
MVKIRERIVHDGAHSTTTYLTYYQGQKANICRLYLILLHLHTAQHQLTIFFGLCDLNVKFPKFLLSRTQWKICITLPIL